MTTIGKTIVGAALLLGLSITPQASAQLLGGYDPYGWSRQSNQQGLDEACKAYRNQYSSIVALHNASRSERDRQSYRGHLLEIQQKINRYCR